MMAKDKAIELVDKMFATSQEDYSITFEEAIDCALICVNEIINSIPTQPSNSKMERIDAITFWMLVKEEIQKL